MVAYLIDSESQSFSLIEIEKAWYLVSLLLRLGRPARPAELSARCSLFCASPDLVEFLCSIQDSPLFLTEDLFVTISLEVVLSAFGEFASKAISSFVPRIWARVSWPKRLWEDSVQTYFRKRKGARSDLLVLPIAKRRLLSDSRHIFSSKAKANVGDNISGNVGFLPFDMPGMEYATGTFGQESPVPRLLIASDSVLSRYRLDEIEVPRLLIASDSVLSRYRLDEIDHKSSNDTDMKCNNTRSVITCKESPGYVNLAKYQHDFLSTEIDLTGTLRKPILWNEIHRDENFSHTTGQATIRSKLSSTAGSCLEAYHCHCCSMTSKVVHDNLYSNAIRSEIMKDSGTTGFLCWRDRDFLDTGISRGGSESCVPHDNAAQIGELSKTETTIENQVKCVDKMTTLSTAQTAAEVEIPVNSSLEEPCITQKLPIKSFSKQSMLHMDALTMGNHDPLELLDDNKLTNPFKQQKQDNEDEKCMHKKQKSKRSRNHNVPTKEHGVNSMPKANKNHLELKALPNFESFTVEEEEGSGGYGTVYRARRRDDGKTFAVKCPHANAHAHHVNNELKMLERFGGRNFVIRYEGSFKSGSSDCFVLEHVEHDRPEVLKREIDLSELQWYGYCMFKALASLHKQGIVHRDVKPGNFLFSRKRCKGYLIDFNLAMDLNQKYCTNSNSETNNNGNLGHVPRPNIKDYSAKEARKAAHGRVLEAINRETSRGSSIQTNNAKKRVDVKAFNDISSRIIHRSQGADVSGVNSTKDATSTRTPSAERLREPMPCRGRKELISLVQEALQGPNYEAVSAPASQRKRVAALPGKSERRLVYLSPMPLHSSGIAVAGAGLLKSRGDRKQRREGPCVGTKGFRAPEVLFKSPHQGPKVDMWSAGVTLLYLMIGRTPFVGDPEQNIKDIAKLRGSEDLWELAKLHNRESSFPVGLFDIQSLPSTDLRVWCGLNTRRPDFHEVAPWSLFDLVDKCLAVNPRLRISADEALRHEFFAPCHEALRKQRLLKRSLSSESGSQSLRLVREL